MQSQLKQFLMVMVQVLLELQLLVMALIGVQVPFVTFIHLLKLQQQLVLLVMQLVYNAKAEISQHKEKLLVLLLLLQPPLYLNTLK